MGAPVPKMNASRSISQSERRELEGDDEAYAWTQAPSMRVSRDWPSDDEAANVTHDDLFDDDE
jgi:hypothetical protein